MNARLLVSTVFVSALVLACDRDLGPTPSPAMQPPARSGLHLIGPVPGPGRRPQAMSNPLRDDQNALLEGRRLFNQMNCAGCHGTHAGGGMGPSLRDPAWIYGNGEADIYDSIAAGRANGMPAWAETLPSETIWQLVSYIHSLGTSDEPSPPR
jgi:cytochrome c oxidase cbb3-type subunit III